MSEQSRGRRTRPKAAPHTDLVVRAVSVADMKEAWSQGLRDFRAAPAYGLVFGGFYTAGGIIIALTVTALGVGYLAYPLAAGFALSATVFMLRAVPILAAGIRSLERPIPLP